MACLGQRPKVSGILSEETASSRPDRFRRFGISNLRAFAVVALFVLENRWR